MKEASVDTLRGERVIAVLLCLLGVYVFWNALGMPAGTFSTPGPGFFPRAVGLLLAVSAAAILLRRGAERGVARFALGEIAPCAGVLLAAALLFDPLGAVATLGLTAAALCGLIGRGPWWKGALFGACASLGTWLFFIQLLGVQMPKGPF